MIIWTKIYPNDNGEESEMSCNVQGLLSMKIQGIHKETAPNARFFGEGT